MGFNSLLWQVVCKRSDHTKPQKSMLLRLQNAVTSMVERQREVERLANNLANANTTGYREDRMFTEVLNEELDYEGSPVSRRLMSQWANTQQGSFESTGNPTDVSINGDGYFVVTDEATGESFYTRNGNFMLNNEGTLINARGQIVEGVSGPISFPPDGTDIVITSRGEIVVDDQEIGQLQIVQFADAGGLERVEGASFREGNQFPEPVEEPELMQGYLETSNVNTIAAMTELIENSRFFEMQQKALQSINTKLQRVTRELGRF